MISGWMCWYCQYENDDADIFCHGSCGGMPVEASMLRGRYEEMCPGKPQLYSLDACVKALAEHNCG